MSHLAHTSINAGEADESAAVSKRMKYSTITNTHAFVAVALESGGVWCCWTNKAWTTLHESANNALDRARGERVNARGLHGLVCRKRAGRQQRHNMINEIVWRALGRASIPSKKEPLGLTMEDGKRPDGVTLFPWSCGRCLT